MPITDWPEQERPREKLLERGASASRTPSSWRFSSGSACEARAPSISRATTHHFGGVRALVSAQPKAFAAVHGVGLAKYAQLQAAFELARRALAETAREADLLSDPESVKDWLRLRLAGLEHEVFYALLLDNRHRLLAAHELFRGTVDQTARPTRADSSSWRSTPTQAPSSRRAQPPQRRRRADRADAATARCAKALALIDVRLLDHFIVTAGNVVSLAQLGMLYRPERAAKSCSKKNPVQNFKKSPCYASK